MKSKKINKLLLTIVLLLFIGLASCVGESESQFSVWSTYTMSPSPTATCAPITLSTPVGWSSISRLTIIIFDEEKLDGSGYLELEDGNTTTDPTIFVNEIIPKIVRPGDQISIFKLGYRNYENARYSRLYSYIDMPQLYDTPVPFATNPPLQISTPSVTPEDLAVYSVTQNAKATMTAYSITSTAIVQSNNCLLQGASQDTNKTATAWSMTELAEVSVIQDNSNSVATLMANQNTFAETPYSKSVVFDGLSHASVDIQSDCAIYDICALIIIDDLSTWTESHQGKLEINLKGVDLIYSIIPNCRDINQPSCKKLQDFWSVVFTDYKIENVVFTNGVRAESQLLKTFGR